jgi:hypothetical protein
MNQNEYTRGIEVMCSSEASSNVWLLSSSIEDMVAVKKPTEISTDQEEYKMDRARMPLSSGDCVALVHPRGIEILARRK